MNQYELALYEVGSVLEGYTYDEKFHLLGFGGAPCYLIDKLESGKNQRCWNLDGSQFSSVIEAKV